VSEWVGDASMTRSPWPTDVLIYKSDLVNGAQSFLENKKFFSDSLEVLPVVDENFLHFQTGPGAHLASCTMDTESFLWVKQPGRGADHPPCSSAKVNRGYICTSNPPPLGFRVCYVVPLFLVSKFSQSIFFGSGSFITVFTKGPNLTVS
jgi:hypothetical protein